MKNKLKKILSLSSVILMGVSAISMINAFTTPTTVQAEEISETRKSSYKGKVDHFRSQFIEFVKKAQTRDKVRIGGDFEGTGEELINKQFLDYSSLLAYQEDASNKLGYGQKYKVSGDIHGNLPVFIRDLLETGAVTIDETQPVRLFNYENNRYYDNFEQFKADRDQEDRKKETEIRRLERAGKQQEARQLELAPAKLSVLNTYVIPNVKVNPGYTGRTDFTGDLVDIHKFKEFDNSNEIAVIMQSIRDQENATGLARIFFDNADHEVAHVIGGESEDKGTRQDLHSTNGQEQLSLHSIMKDLFLPKKGVDPKGVASSVGYDPTTNASFAHINLNPWDVENSLIRLRELITNHRRTIDNGETYSILTHLKSLPQYNEYFDNSNFSDIKVSDLTSLIAKVRKLRISIKLDQLGKIKFDGENVQFNSTEKANIHNYLNLITRVIMFLKSDVNGKDYDVFHWYERTLMIPDVVQKAIESGKGSGHEIEPGFYNENPDYQSQLSDYAIQNASLDKFARGLFMARINQTNMTLIGPTPQGFGWNQFYGHDTLKFGESPTRVYNDSETAFSMQNDVHNHQRLISYSKNFSREEWEKCDPDQLTTHDYTDLVAGKFKVIFGEETKDVDLTDLIGESGLSVADIKRRIMIEFGINPYIHSSNACSFYGYDSKGKESVSRMGVDNFKKLLPYSQCRMHISKKPKNIKIKFIRGEKVIKRTVDVANCMNTEDVIKKAKEVLGIKDSKEYGILQNATISDYDFTDESDREEIKSFTLEDIEFKSAGRRYKLLKFDQTIPISKVKLELYDKAILNQKTTPAPVAVAKPATSVATSKPKLAPVDDSYTLKVQYGSSYSTEQWDIKKPLSEWITIFERDHKINDHQQVELLLDGAVVDSSTTLEELGYEEGQPIKLDLKVSEKVTNTKKVNFTITQLYHIESSRNH